MKASQIKFCTDAAESITRTRPANIAGQTVRVRAYIATPFTLPDGRAGNFWEVYRARDLPDFRNRRAAQIIARKINAGTFNLAAYQ